MFRKFLWAIAFITPSLANAGLLHYDLNFESYDPEHSVSGNGFILADTDLNAVVGGQLVCDEFVFSWSDGSPQALTQVGEYYGANVVSGGLVNGTDGMTGEAGTLELMFLLWPPVEGDGFADKLDAHFPEDIWSTLHVPSEARGDGHWLNAPVTTHFTLDAPVNVLQGLAEATDVPAPSSLPLFALGGLLLVWRRYRG